MRDAYVQVNVSNLTDEYYPINISSGTNALLIRGREPGSGCHQQPRRRAANLRRGGAAHGGYYLRQQVLGPFRTVSA